MATNNAWNSQDPVQVGLGGTGVATLLAHGVMVGEGTSAVVSLAVGTTGQVLIGSSAADPAFGALGVNSSLTAHGVVVAEGTSAFVATAAGTNGQVLIAGTSADPAFATISSTGGTIAFTAGSNTLNMDVVGGGTPWTDVSGTSASMAANNGYIADNAGLVTLTLPATAAFGSTVKVGGKGAGGWIIAQNTGQIIHFGSVATTSGATGSLASSNQWDQVDLLCVTANTTWVVRAVQGNLTYV